MFIQHIYLLLSFLILNLMSQETLEQPQTTYTHGIMTGTVSPSSLKIKEITEYDLSFTTSRKIPYDASIVIEFPKELIVCDNVSVSVTLNDSLNENIYPMFSFANEAWHQERTTLRIDNFVEKGFLYSPTTFSLHLSNIRNPGTIQPSSSFNISAISKRGNIIDQVNEGLTVTMDEILYFNISNCTTGNTKVYHVDVLSCYLLIENSVDKGDILELSLPSMYKFDMDQVLTTSFYIYPLNATYGKEDNDLSTYWFYIFKVPTPFNKTCFLTINHFLNGEYVVNESRLSLRIIDNLGYPSMLQNSTVVFPINISLVDDEFNAYLEEILLDRLEPLYIEYNVSVPTRKGDVMSLWFTEDIALESNECVIEVLNDMSNETYCENVPSKSTVYIYNYHLEDVPVPNLKFKLNKVKLNSNVTAHLIRLTMETKNGEIKQTGTNNIIFDCEDGCHACGLNKRFCLECTRNLPYYDDYNGKCYQTWDMVGFYNTMNDLNMTTDYIVRKCNDPNCKYCYADTFQCAKCKTGFHLSYWQTHTFRAFFCSSTCTGYVNQSYWSEDFCMICDGLLCNYTEVLACNPLSNKKYLDKEMNTCVENIPKGYYAEDYTLKKCTNEGCSSYCLSESTCLYCDVNYYFYDGKCISQEACESMIGYRTANVNGTLTCKKCMDGCANCLQFEDQCTKCFSQYTLVDGMCIKNEVEEDPFDCDYWQIRDENGVCQNCREGCEECVGSVDNCTLCFNGLYIENGRCVKECSEGLILENNFCKEQVIEPYPDPDPTEPDNPGSNSTEGAFFVTTHKILIKYAVSFSYPKDYFSIIGIAVAVGIGMIITKMINKKIFMFKSIISILTIISRVLLVFSYIASFKYGEHKYFVPYAIILFLHSVLSFIMILVFNYHSKHYNSKNLIISSVLCLFFDYKSIFILSNCYPVKTNKSKSGTLVFILKIGLVFDVGLIHLPILAISIYSLFTIKRYSNIFYLSIYNIVLSALLISNTLFDLSVTENEQKANFDDNSRIRLFPKEIQKELESLKKPNSTSNMISSNETKNTNKKNIEMAVLGNDIDTPSSLNRNREEIQSSHRLLNGINLKRAIENSHPLTQKLDFSQVADEPQKEHVQVSLDDISMNISEVDEDIGGNMSQAPGNKLANYKSPQTIAKALNN